MTIPHSDAGEQIFSLINKNKTPSSGYLHLDGTLSPLIAQCESKIKAFQPVGLCKVCLLLYSQKLCQLLFSKLPIISKLFSINNVHVIKMILNLFCSYTATLHLVEYYSLPKLILVQMKKSQSGLIIHSLPVLLSLSAMYSRVTFGEACLDMKTTMHVVGNEVIDLSTLN